MAQVSLGDGIVFKMSLFSNSHRDVYVKEHNRVTTGNQRLIAICIHAITTAASAAREPAAVHAVAQSPYMSFVAATARKKTVMPMGMAALLESNIPEQSSTILRAQNLTSTICEEEPISGSGGSGSSGSERIFSWISLKRK
jgi:hypothetical protein